MGRYIKENMDLTEDKDDGQQAAAAPEQAKQVVDTETQVSVPRPPPSAGRSGGLTLDFSRPRLIVVLGAPHSGKSYACRWIARRMAEAGLLKFARVYSKTAKVNKEWDIFPDEAIHDISVAEIASFHDKLLKYRERTGKMPPRSLHVIDDSLGALRNVYDPALMSVLSTHRHANSDIWMLVQHTNGVSTVLRSMCDYAIIFREKFARSQPQGRVQLRRRVV